MLGDENFFIGTALCLLNDNVASERGFHEKYAKLGLENCLKK
jgi:hypothetical protein